MYPQTFFKTFKILKKKFGSEGWLMPVIPALWEVEVGRLLEIRGSRPSR